MASDKGELFQPFVVPPRPTEREGGKGVLIRDVVTVGKDEVWYIESESEGDWTGKIQVIDLKGDGPTRRPLPEKMEEAFRMRVVGDEVWVCCERKIARYSIRDGTWRFYAMNVDYGMDKGTKGYKVREEGGWKEPEDYDACYNCISVDDRRVYVGLRAKRDPWAKSTDFSTFGGGVLVFDKAANKWEWVLTGEDTIWPDISTIGSDRDSIWVGTGRGINIYDLKTKDLEVLTEKEGLPYDTVEIITATEDIIWISTPRDLYWYEKKDKRWVRFFQDDPENMFFEYYEPEKRTWSFLKDTENMSQGRKVLCIWPVGDKLFFGTQLGLVIYDRAQDKWSSYSFEDGLTNVDVTSVTIHGDLLIVGTLNGIFAAKLTGLGSARGR